MPQTVEFESVSPRHKLAYLVAGQAQKEFFVNEALARLDALLFPVVEGSAIAPPAQPVAGEAWIVAAPAEGEFAQMEEHIASWDGEQWGFVEPVAGMSVHDRSTGCMTVHSGGWQAAIRPADPSGGSTIDSEARTTIAAIVDILATVLIIPSD